MKGKQLYRELPRSKKTDVDAEEFLDSLGSESSVFDSDLGSKSLVSSTRLSSLSRSPESISARSLTSGREEVASLPTQREEESLSSFLSVAAAKDPAPVGHWKRGFETVRQLRNHPKLRPFRADYYGAFDLIEATAPGWIVDSFGSEEAFFEKWDAVRRDLDDDSDPLADSVHEAKDNPIPFPGRLTPISRHLGSIAAYQSRRSSRFQLPQPQLAEMTGIEQRTISAAIRSNLIPLGILREAGVEGRKKLYTYHGPQPLTGDNSVPQVDPLETPVALEDRQRKWAKPPIDRPKPEGNDPYLVLSEADGRNWYLTADFYEDLQSRYPDKDVYKEINALRNKLRDFPEARPNSMRSYIEGWMKRAKPAEREQVSMTPKPGDPRDGEKDDKGNRWSAFNRRWTPQGKWMPKGRMEAINNILLLSVYDE